MAMADLKTVQNCIRLARSSGLPSAFQHISHIRGSVVFEAKHGILARIPTDTSHCTTWCRSEWFSPDRRVVVVDACAQDRGLRSTCWSDISYYDRR